MTMPNFLPCFGQPSRHRSRQVPNPNTASTFSTHGHRERRRYGSSEVGNGDSNGGSGSPVSLPVIKDRGPPNAKNYENPNVYWNSIMIEADEDEKARPTARSRGKGRSEAGRSGLPNAIGAESFQARGSNHALEDTRVNDSTAEITPAQYGRHKNGHAHRFWRRKKHSKGQFDHNLNVMSSSMPNHTSLPVGQVQPPRPPASLIPGTFAWDDFVDPLEYTPRSRLPNPRQINNRSGEPRRTYQSFDGIQEEKDLPDVPYEYYGPAFSPSPDSRKTPPMTWNACLNKVLGQDSVDQEMVERVKERVKNSTTTNGDVENKDFHVSAVEAGLVPNFSYPVTGSAFYDRIFAAQSPHPASTNGVLPSSPDELDTEPDRHTSTATNRSVDFDFDLPKAPSTLSSLLRSPTSSTNDSLYRSPTPPSTSTTRRRLDALLTEMLSPSELDLCQTVLRPPPRSPPRLDPLPTRLTLSLHRALLHLQDRVIHLEDGLLPQLGTALEQKTYTIDVLSVEVRNLDDQIHQLKLALDFGNKILAGCWVREYEVWRTLLGIRERRRRKEWWRWVWSSKKVGEGILSPDEGGKVEVGMDKERGMKLALRNGEIEALIGMARQNVDILREDVEDMVEKVERCRREYTPYPAVERVEGSWRDV